MARDKFHEDFRVALEKDGWIITHDPLTIKIGQVHIQIDLGAEQLILAERDVSKIAIEIKTFTNPSFITSIYEAVGQYIIYRNALKIRAPERVLYLAIPEGTFNRFFVEAVIQRMMQDEGFKIIVYDQYTKNIIQWTN